MSKLYYSEQGNVIPGMCEELTTYRHARKLLTFPATAQPATVYVLARSYPDNTLPLRVSVNGVELPGIQTYLPNIYFWYQVSVPPALLKDGANLFEFWTDSHSMNAWSLALENGHRQPQSFVSTDYGETWRNEMLGYHNVGLGEYVVRVRLEEGFDPAPPPLTWENREHPRLQRIKELLPESVCAATDKLVQVRELLSWVSTQWYYRHTGPGSQYAPWDAETIMAWGRAEQGHNGRSPVVMCVHYGVTFVSFCLALGIPARAAVFTGDLNGFNGHFTAEVWLKEYAKWVMVDPTADAMVFKNNTPLSVTEIQAEGDDLTPYLSYGAGNAYQMQNPVIATWIPENLAKGVCFRHRSIWQRNDFIAHPEFAPPGHGETAYSETRLIWETKDLAAGFGMFPYFGSNAYFDAPPEGY